MKLYYLLILDSFTSAEMSILGALLAFVLLVVFLTSRSTTKPLPVREARQSPILTEGRLENLENLRQKNLITDEEYRVKRSRILDEV